MTLYSIARANNMTVSQLASPMASRRPYAVHSGQTLRIPGHSDPAMPQTASAAPKAAPSAKPFKQGPSVAAASSAGAHTVGNGDTLFSLGRKYNVSPYAIADANGLPHNAQLSLGQQVKIPGSKGGATVAFNKKHNTGSPKLQTAADPDSGSPRYG